MNLEPIEKGIGWKEAEEGLADLELTMSEQIELDELSSIEFPSLEELEMGIPLIDSKEFERIMKEVDIDKIEMNFDDLPDLGDLPLFEEIDGEGGKSKQGKPSMKKI